MIKKSLKKGLQIMDTFRNNKQDYLPLEVTPIFVDCIGRTGSTLLMNLLGTSEQIRFDKQYPFENRIFSNLLQIVRMFQADYNPVSPHNFTINKDQFFSTVAFTKNTLFNKNEFSKKAFKLLFEAAVTNEEIKGRYATLFYAEKTPFSSEIEKLIGKFNKKHIFLYRDPRAVIVSSNKFNIKRGFLDFWWEEEDDYFSYIQKNMHYFKEQLEKALKYKNSNEVFVVKYEDMIEKPSEISSGLNNWLGLTQSPIDYNKVSQIKYHMTNSNSNDSVEAWKRELDRKTLELINGELGTLLKQCGYELY